LNIFIESELSELVSDFIESDSLVASSCIDRINENGGTLAFTSRDQLAQTPNESTTASYPTGTIQTIPESTAAFSIDEPQAIYELADGRLVMNRDC